MPTSHYDLVVLGDDTSGMVAATLCARRGLRVLWLQSPFAATTYQVGSHRVPVEPLPLVGLGSPATRRVLDELHFQHVLKRKLRPVPQTYQVVAPDLRFAVDADDAVFERELERELLGGAEAAARFRQVAEQTHEVAQLLDPVFSLDIAVPPTGFWERREIGRTADRLEADSATWDDSLKSDIAKAIFGLPAVFGSSIAPGHHSPQSRARAFAEWRQGVGRLPGDHEALRALFIDKFTSHNGEVRVAIPRALQTSWGKVTGVVLDSGEEIGAGHLVAAMPLDELAPLGDKKLAKRIAEVADEIQLGGYRYTMHLVLDARGVPEGMGPQVLTVADPKRPLLGDNALAIFVDPPDSEARVLVTVQAICPPPDDGDGGVDRAFAALRRRIREQLEIVMPFYSQHVLAESSPLEPQAAATGGASAEPAPARPRPLWLPVKEPLLGVAGVGYQIGVKHLTIASSQILPGLGLEGEMATGYCAAKLVCEASGKSKRGARDDVLSAGRP